MNGVTGCVSSINNVIYTMYTVLVLVMEQVYQPDWFTDLPWVSMYTHMITFIFHKLANIHMILHSLFIFKHIWSEPGMEWERVDCNECCSVLA